jgi:hypothetical protein
MTTRRTTTRRITTRRISTTLAASLLLLAACGGSDSASTSDDTQAPDDAAAPATAAADDTATDDTAADDGATTTDGDSTGDFEPGDVEFRVVNTLAEPVDVYVRTSGLVEAFPIQSGVGPGEVTDFVAPPTDGVFLVTEAGAGDPTCVSGCDHFIAELSALDDQGPVHTVVLYDDEFNGPSAFDLWEDPAPGNEVNSNAMPPADPASGVVVVTAVSVTDADFGLRLALAGTAGCLDPFNLENILVGGNQTPAFTYDGDSVEFVLHDNADRECAEEPVGGPFAIDGGPGSRSHLILTGSPGDMDAIVVPMGDDASSDAGTTDAGESGEAATDDDRALAVELMTAEIAANLPFDDAQSACAAEFLVDAIGVDELLVDGDLVDLDSLPTEAQDAAAAALAAAVPACDIDPALLDG